jgi:hypothetical protein
MNVPLITLSAESSAASPTSHSPLDGDVQVGNVVQDKLDELLVFLLSNMTDEGSPGQFLAELVGDETVLGETIVKVVDDCE